MAPIQGMRLYQNCPNPFNATTAISYEIPTSGEITLKIVNVLGKEVRILTNKNQTTGSYSVVWDGKDDLGKGVNSGFYFYKLESDKGLSQSRKLLLIK